MVSLFVLLIVDILLLALLADVAFVPDGEMVHAATNGNWLIPLLEESAIVLHEWHVLSDSSGWRGAVTVRTGCDSTFIEEWGSTGSAKFLGR